MTIKELLNLLKDCPNITHFFISEVLIEKSTFDTRDIPSYDFISIYFKNSSPVIFEIFQNSTATEIIIDNMCSGFYGF